SAVHLQSSVYSTFVLCLSPKPFYTLLFLFSFQDPATTDIYSLSLHDALPICRTPSCASSSYAGPVRRPASAATATRCPWSPRCRDRKSTRLNSSHVSISYAVFCLKKKIVNIRPEILVPVYTYQLEVSEAKLHP